MSTSLTPDTPLSVSRWAPARFEPARAAFPMVTAADARPIIPDLDLWDCWPVEERDGHVARIGGAELWFFLSSPRFPDPGMRHDAARLRLVARDAAGWRDLGQVLDEGVSPGSREWAGSAVLDADRRGVMLYFTAAGRPETPGSFEQRLFETHASIENDTLVGWTPPAEIVSSDGVRYAPAREAKGEPGAIKAFRDPAWFCDPATGKEHLLFTGSAGWDADPYNGVIGLITRVGDRWRLDDPLVEAVGVNNELERPHVRMFGGRYYLFFSTQGRTFAPAAPRGPNGLYGLVADALEGPWTPVNDTGLVAGNPAAEPTQVYSWWVTADARVTGFIDHWGMSGRNFDTHPELLRSQFGGTPAPEISLVFDGAKVEIAQ